MGFMEREIKDFQRFEEILEILVEEGFGFFLGKLNLLGHLPFVQRLSKFDDDVPPPERVRHTFERLGPTYVKFGQILAQRPDIVPDAYIEELQKLEDSVPPFDSETAKEIIAEDIGPVDEVFETFEDEPIAAASIAQVHRATLHNGNEVVVKVRRPGIKDQMEEDLDILLFFAKRGEDVLKKWRKMQVKQYVHEFARWTRDELNLEKEGRNARIMQQNMADEERIKIPDTYPDYTSERVLVMEYMEGVKCTETEKLQAIDADVEDIAQTAIRAGLKQTIRDGFFHADPHPSNFLINENGEIVFLDFGMMGKFSMTTRRNLGLLSLHVANEDVEAAVETVKRIGTIEDDADLDGLKADIEESMLLIRNTTLAEHSITRALMNIAVRAAQRGVHLPSSMMIMGKSLLTMEGIGLAIYPDFQITDEFEDTIQELLWEMNDPRRIVNTFLLDVMENRDLLVRLPTQLHKIVDGLEHSGQQTIIDNTYKNHMNTLLIGALILSSSLLFIETLPQQDLYYIAVAELVVAAFLVFRSA